MLKQKGEGKAGGETRQVFIHKETERESHGHWLGSSGMHRVSSAFASQIYNIHVHNACKSALS